MAKHENGVTNYTTGYARVKVSFANNETNCLHCEYCWEDKGRLPRCRCRLLKDEIIPVDCVAFGRLPDCPIEFEED